MNQRHRDLNTNELEKLMASISPWLEKHGNKLIYAACAVMLAFAAYYYWSKSSAIERSAGWGEFISASEMEDYANISSRFKGTPPGQWALLTQANVNLENGLRLMFSDRAGAVSDLKSAQEKYAELLDDPKLSPELEERALFGRARCLESLSGDDTSGPVEAYEELLEKFPDSIFKNIADHQIKALKQNDGQQFYAWFEKQDPKPAKPSTPFDKLNLPEGHTPIDPGSQIRLPDTPDMLKLPEGSAPVFPEGLGGSESESTIPPAPPKPIDPNADSSAPEGSAPPLPENP